MYNLEVFTDQFEYVDFDFIDERQPLDMDYLAYNAYTVTTKMMDAKKGYFVRITRDNVHVASGYIADVQPGKTTQEISIKPLQSLFDVEVFYTPVSDCITWLATNIQAALMNNADTLQNRPITLTYTASADALPLTGFNLHKTVNILSVIISALKTYGVVCTMSLDVTNKRIVVDIAQQTATQTIEANLENVLQSSVTLGDSYGSTNKLIIRKTDKDSGENLGETIFYLHNDGTINTTDTNRIYPVFWELETLDTEDDQTAAQWLEKATARAKEVLEPAKYDNEIVLMYDVDDQIVHPADAQIGTDTTIYLDGLTYASILTGKKIEGQKITLTYGVVRQDLTKKLAIRQRETMTFENTASAIIQEAREVFPSKSAVDKGFFRVYPRPASTYGTSFNNFINTGLYPLDGTTLSNGPAVYTWGYLRVNNVGGWIVQEVIKNAYRYTRAYVGSPATWTGWTQTAMGDLNDYKKNIVFKYDHQNNPTGYGYIAQIKVNTAYVDVPISFLIARRSSPMAWVEIRFYNSSSTDPNVASFVYYAPDTQNVFHLIKSSTSTWRLYVDCPNWGSVTVLQQNIPYENQITINYIGSPQTTALSWTHTATKGNL